MSVKPPLKVLKQRLKRINTRLILFAIFSATFRTRIYRRLGAKFLSQAPKFQITNLWPGNVSQGLVIMEGDFEFLGTQIRDSDMPWVAKNVSDEWLSSLAEFNWLQDLRAVGTDAARDRARHLISLWIDTDGNHRGKNAWRPSVVGNRLSNWIDQREFLAAGANPSFLNKLDASIYQHNRFLRHLRLLLPPGFGKIIALKGLILSALSNKNHRYLIRLCKHLDREIGAQILGDGGHTSRNPIVEVELLRHLIDIRTALKNSNEEVSKYLEDAIDKVAPMVRFFRHGDGGLALFNGSHEGEGWQIDVILSRSEARGKPFSSTPHSGFERMSNNRTLLIMDVGSPASIGFDEKAHSGALSVEMSVGKERIITNCGAYIGAVDSWADVQRTTAAHSTVTLENLNSSELLLGGGIGTRPESVASERREADGNIWINAALVGYGGQKKITHSRRIYLSANGGDIRGEDTISGGDSEKFVARFHLHPSVQSSLVRQASSVLLRTPSGSGWRFKASGGVISLQESIYLGLPGQVKRAEQIVISSATQNGVGQIKWALSRLADEI
jgi:uncharacterized heparinase superfamily protein